MEENKNPDFKNKNNSVENNSNPRLGLSNSNFRPGSSNSNPRPGPSNSSSRPGLSNSIPRPGPSNTNPRSSSSSNHWQDRDRKTPKKSSHSDDEWDRDNKLNKRETPDKMKKEGNSENDGNERPNENSNEVPLVSLHDIALASQRRSVAMSQQQMAVPLPHQSQPQMMHQQPIPYSTYSYSASENYHMDPNQGAYSVNPFSSMMPINSQWPANNTMPATAGNIASTSGMGISNGMEMVAPANGNINAYPYMNMGNNDGSLYGMLPIIQSIPNFSTFPVNINSVDTIIPMFNNLEPITTNHAVLTPPLPGERRSRRPKPPGCRTVFVGNLPEKITEEIIKEAFKICGPISVVRMSKKNFCHIRFVNMESVDQALLLSGFRIRIDENEDPAYNGRLHVDYAVARDDQHEYECLERARLREERHRQKEAFRPPSPPPIPHFSEHEAQTLAERLRNEETFREGLQVLITWLDRGECNKRNSGTFYSLIQSSHSHVKRVRNEKSRYEEEAEKAKENLQNKNRAIGQEINDIEKVFVAAKTQKVWDHFNVSQRKKMEEMKNDTYDLKQTNSEDLLDHRVEEEMELSDNEDRNDNGENGKTKESDSEVVNEDEEEEDDKQEEDEEKKEINKEDSKDVEKGEEKTTSDSEEQKSVQLNGSDSKEGSSKCASVNSRLSPPKPETAPVVVPLTVEDVIKLDTSIKIKASDNDSLIVNPDDTQSDMDSSVNERESINEDPTADEGAENSENVDPESAEKNDVLEENDIEMKDATVKDSNSTVDISKDNNIPSGIDKPSLPSGNDKPSLEQTDEASSTVMAKSPEKRTKSSADKDEHIKRVAASSKNLWVSGLAEKTRAKDLKALFSKFGKVSGAKIVTNARTPGSRCYGFITMASSEEALICVDKLNHTELHGKIITVEKTTREPTGTIKRADFKAIKSKAVQKKSSDATNTESVGDKIDEVPKTDGRDESKSADRPKVEKPKSLEKTKSADKSKPSEKASDKEGENEKSKDGEVKEVVLRRWTNVRDSFARFCRKERKKSDARESTKRKRIKKYIYHNQMRFLRKLYDAENAEEDYEIEKKDDASRIGTEKLITSVYPNTRSQETEAFANTIYSEFRSRDAETMSNAEGEDNLTSAGTASTVSQHSGPIFNKRKRLDESELHNSKVHVGEKSDRHLSFFKGIIPSLGEFNEQEILKFQMGVLQLISNISDVRN